MTTDWYEDVVGLVQAENEAAEERAREREYRNRHLGRTDEVDLEDLLDDMD